MSIKINYLPDGMIEINCGDESVLIPPRGVPPKRTETSSKREDDLGSPPPGPRVMFCIADPLRGIRPDNLLWSSRLRPDPTKDIVQIIKRGSPRRPVDIRFVPKTSFDLKTLTDMAEGADVDIRLWIPPTDGSE